MVMRERLARAAFWTNPVVGRDLRVRLRGAKSYWFQGAYLGLLSVLALSGYGIASAMNRFGSIVSMQQQLQGFYYFIFMTLAGLICLIAPALTAAAITTERQRLTLDLLTTTPMTAGELLVGKLVSSIAFLALLLVLSLPASALCVILGGSTLGDVFRVYVLIAIDGLILAAIGLYYSCAVRASLPALVWTYASVIGFLVMTGLVLSVSGVSGILGRGHSNIAACFACLNPFVAVYMGAQSFDLLINGMTYTLPIWVGSSVFALLGIRLLVTAATYRMGGYGGNPAASLRRQVLFLTGLLGLCAGYGLSGGVGRIAATGSSSYVEFTLLAGFALALPFLPALFAPAAPEDAMPGVSVPGKYALRHAFRPEHDGALPYFHLWLLTGVGSIALGAWGDDIELALLTGLYLLCAGFLVWSLARRASTWVRGVSAARSLTFALMVVLAAIPFAIIGLSDNGDWANHPLSYVWVLNPLLHTQRSDAPQSLLLTSGLCFVLGMIIYFPWRDVVPGGVARVKKAPRPPILGGSELSPSVPTEGLRKVGSENKISLGSEGASVSESAPVPLLSEGGVGGGSEAEEPGAIK